MIRFSALIANLGIFIVPLTAVLGAALWNMATYIWAQRHGQVCDDLTLENINECSTLVQIVGMSATIAGLVAGLSRVDPGNPTSLVAAMGLAFWGTYFALAVAGLCRVFIMVAPYLNKLRRTEKAAAEVKG